MHLDLLRTCSYTLEPVFASTCCGIGKSCDSFQNFANYSCLAEVVLAQSTVREYVKEVKRPEYFS